MSNNEETITIPTNNRENLVKHIEELQRVITEKNELIEALQKENTELIEAPSDFLSRIKDEAWRSGYSACGNALKDTLEHVNQIATRTFL